MDKDLFIGEVTMTLHFEYDKALKYMRCVYRAYSEKTHLYSRVHATGASAPQVMYRPKGLDITSPEYHKFLFFATLMTYRSESEAWFRQAVAMYKRFPYLFSREVIFVSCEEVQKALKDVGFMHPKQGGSYWYSSAQTLFSKEFKGDPLKLFSYDSVDTFLNFKKYLKKETRGKHTLPGVGPKIYSLMAIFYEEINAIEFLPKGVFPVDLHVMRIMIGLDVLRGEGVVSAQSVAEFTRRKISRMCEENDMPAQNLSHALWFLGNRVCTRCDTTMGLEYICPFSSSCLGGPQTMLYNKRGKWNFDSLRKRKGSPQKAFEEITDGDAYLDILLSKISNSGGVSSTSNVIHNTNQVQEIFKFM